MASSTSTTTATTTVFAEMMNKARTADGFLAALDQSGGSTPKALKSYGVPDDKYVAGEESMFDEVHAMRTRMITSPSFSGDKIVGAILFEDTMDRDIEGKPTGLYLWEAKKIVPFIKCDKGLTEGKDGVQLMKPMPQLDDLLKKAKSKQMFGTKMRSVIKSSKSPDMIQAVVDQQFEVGKQIIDAGLCPILEPEVDINSDDKSTIEDILLTKMLKGLDELPDTSNVMIKLSIPTKVDLYKPLADHPRCVRLVALSGGYSRDEANLLLSKQTNMIASFSRALAEGLSYGQTPKEFDTTMSDNVESIYVASKDPSSSS
mmetsp:Transcript_744/g.1739  ORF Transcript_744/g.1739 Transcript_744/m.1739 type:complete len:316 (+) Transcript_744:158-1105(+)|eukprot:CAMPEP_0113468684 /NCGR_PEP_ID=MMETSP0014_2-20120614/15489_1 /TAXON_ID=2857 /ORGANISM="Nitzschia sp." /LENGTH=315 /DNA_ID=CAMNT_0000361095 /DNA_START=89 /DNA_END=1036 /DNA_ORIENTATION=+ /assembly_acc=CAM_ASM_000159